MFPAYFDTIFKACFNLHVVQILARLACGLSKRERDRLKADFHQASEAEASAERADGAGRGGLAANLGHVIHVMERADLYAVRRSLFPSAGTLRHIGASLS